MSKTANNDSISRLNSRPKFPFPGNGREISNATGREGKFEACIPGNHGKREFPLTPGWTPEFGKLCQIFNTLSKKFRLEPDPDYQNPLHYNTQVTGLATCGVVEWMCCSTIKKSESRSVVEWSVMQPGSSVALVALSQYHVGRTAGTK